MPESTQHKLDRVRPPRVQITYDVETLGSIVKTELPFVVGIMADLSGNAIPDPANPRPNKKGVLKDRKFVEIDRDNFNTIMEKLEPTLQIAGVTVTFKKLEDFNPINVLRSVPTLSAKFDSRTRLSNLIAKLDGNPKLQEDFLNSYYALETDDKTALDAYIAAMNSATGDAPPAAALGKPTVSGATPTPRATPLSGLVIKPADADVERVTQFKISDIKGGALTKKDGGAIEGGLITKKEGADGLTFTPDKTATTGDGSFTVQASTGGTSPVLSEAVITTITVT
jgi:type VI secretion system protein ImpB